MNNHEQKGNCAVGKKISVRGSCFAYLCSACESRIHVSRLFETEFITQAQAAQERAYCYKCYQGLDGSEENFTAYAVGLTVDGQLIPSAFSLLEIALAC